MKNLQIKILHIENDQIQSLLTSMTLSTVLIAIRKLSAEHRGGDYSWISEPKFPQTAQTIDKN